MNQDFIFHGGDFPLGDTIIGGVYQTTPYGDSDGQHIVDNIINTKGSCKQFPTAGFGLRQYLNSEISVHEIENNLNSSLQQDGYSATNGVIVPVKDKFSINSDYIK